MVSGKLYENGNHNTIGHRNGGGTGQCLACPIVLSGTNILCAQG